MMGVPVSVALTPEFGSGIVDRQAEAPAVSSPSQEGASGLPIARVKRIIKEERDVKPVEEEAVLVITRAADLFVEALAARVVDCVQGGKGITYTEVSTAVHSWASCDFLQDIVPPKRTAAEIIALMKQAQQEQA